MQPDRELKGDYQRFLLERNRRDSDSDGRPDRSRQEIEEWAREHDLPYYDDQLHFPDVRVEYEDLDGDVDHRDIEVTTEHYRGGHASSASRSGFAILVPGVSVNAAWFSRDFRNLIARTNTLQSFSDYTRVDVVSPLDGRVIPVYNVSPTAFTRIDNVDSNDPERKMWYNGYEFSFNARLPRGATLFGGTTTERMLWNVCSEKSNPNNLLYCDATQSGIPFKTQLKLAGTYPLPWGIQVSASLQALPGYRLGSNIPSPTSLPSSPHPRGPARSGR